ncbi:MAG: hypothetical protein HYX67_14665 [Candidatus Melainabacteria bacterium]|nr:hypothetical protein [Candidatus Melainabacteria bacterium]
MLHKSIKTVLKLTCVGVCAVLLKQFCSSKTDGFALSKIQSSLPYCKEWETAPPSPDVVEGLAQPFYYLAKGAQSYVFASADGKTVIKFFRLYHLLPPAWMTSLSLPLPLQGLKVTKMLEKRQELAKDFSSYKIAFDQMQDETGLLMLHLNKTSHLNKKLTLYDKIGIAHQVDLDQMEFLVQKRATLVFPSIERLVKTEGVASAKEAISGLVQLLTYRCEKGIFDKDPDLNTNFGFLDKTAVQIDIGRFRFEEERKDPKVYHDEILRITDNFRQWLDVRYPELSEHLMSEIEKI